MPAQPARSPASCGLSRPLARSLGPWRARGPGGASPWCVALAPLRCQIPGRQRIAASSSSLGGACSSVGSPRASRPSGVQENSRNPGTGLLAVFGLDVGPGGDRRVQPSRRGELASGKPERARFRRQLCLHTLIRDFTPPPLPPPLGQNPLALCLPSPFSRGSPQGLLGEAPAVASCHERVTIACKF